MLFNSYFCTIFIWFFGTKNKPNYHCDKLPTRHLAMSNTSMCYSPLVIADDQLINQFPCEWTYLIFDSNIVITTFDNERILRSLPHANQYAWDLPEKKYLFLFNEILRAKLTVNGGGGSLCKTIILLISLQIYLIDWLWNMMWSGHTYKAAKQWVLWKRNANIIIVNTPIE